MAKTPNYTTWQVPELRNESNRLATMARALEEERRLRAHGGQAAARPYYLHTRDELRNESRRLKRDLSAVAAALATK